MARNLRIAILLFLVPIALPAAAQPTVGLFINDAPSPGYTLFSPNGSTTSYLINNDGLVVQSWTGTARPGMMAYLTPLGSVMRTTKVNGSSFPSASGFGGRFEEYDWDGNLIWEYDYESATHMAHHDVERMPNGNWLIIAWDLLDELDAIAEGKNPADITNGNLLIDRIIEVQPTPPVGGTIVWEWRTRDHLIQDFDPTKGNFGVVADHPELIDFNFATVFDLTHFNSVDYNPALDQIAISAHSYDEIWIIDHSTTTAEAAGHSGGTSGMGGDLIYRWGNPQAYQRGVLADQQLSGQHDVQWIEPGLPGADNLLVFDNVNDGAGGPFSSIHEIVPPVDMNNYTLGAGLPYGPAAPVWTYEATPPEDFYGSNTSGVFRLTNGNTLITIGPRGRIFEVEPDGTVTWDYQNSDTLPGLLTQGDPVLNGTVFKARRYPPGDPALAGRDLTPGDPVELFSRPAPTQSLLVDKLGAAAFRMALSWSDGGCVSFEYHVLYGDLANVATASVDSALCDVGTSGSFTWQGTPGNSVFFMVVGTDITGVYESSWGDTTAGPRGGTKASFQCGTTTKILDPQCP